MTFDEILDRFPGSRKPNGSGGLMVPCPAHGDERPSLSISPGNGHGPLFKCFGGCDTKDVLAAAGLDWQDILPPRETPRAMARPSTEPIVRHEIRDPTGTLIAIHARRGSGQEKRVWYEMPDGKKMLDRPKASLPLYGVDRLPKNTTVPVVVTEGEKAADALLLNGIPAVGTVTGASGTPGDDALRPLLGRPVYLWPDADDPGRKHFDRIADALKRLGHQDVRLIDWKAAPPKGDAADLFALEGAADELAVLMDEARLLTPVPRPPLFESLSVLLTKQAPRTWLIKGLIESPATGVMFGPSGTGKSFISVDLAASCASGVDWNGRRVASPGPTFYIAGEGKVGLLRRFQAWQLARKIQIPEDRLFLSTMRVELGELGAEAVETEIDRRAKEIGAPPVLIVIDTLARALPSGADENSAKDIGAFVNVVDRIRDRFNCVVLIVHHSGITDDKRTRGSSALKAALEIELCVTKKAGTRTAEWTKLKDLPDEPHPQEFILERVLLGVEDDGDLISSCCVKWGEQASARATISTTRAENLGLETLRALTVKEGASSAALEDWRAAFYAKYWGDDMKAKQKAFFRVRESLVGKELIQVIDGKYSLLGRQRETKGDIVSACPGTLGRHPETHPYRGVSVSPSPVSQGEDE